jgi:hypothetical protein
LRDSVVAVRIEVAMTGEFSALYTMQIIPFKTDQDGNGAVHLAANIKAIQLGGTKTLSAYFSNLDEFMNRLGLMLRFDSVQWRQLERLLNQQGKVNVAGPNAELAFTELELRELGLEEDVLRAA